MNVIILYDRDSIVQSSITKFAGQGPISLIGYFFNEIRSAGKWQAIEKLSAKPNMGK